MVNFDSFLTGYIERILSGYNTQVPIYLTTSIGWDGLTVSQQVTVYTPPQDTDVLVYGVNVDFSNASATLQIQDTATGYVWNANFTPFVAVAGISTQVRPVLPLPIPYLLKRQNKLQLVCKNSATSLTSNGNITFVGLRLQNN